MGLDSDQSLRESQSLLEVGILVLYDFFIKLNRYDFELQGFLLTLGALCH